MALTNVNKNIDGFLMWGTDDLDPVMPHGTLQSHHGWMSRPNVPREDTLVLASSSL